MPPREVFVPRFVISAVDVSDQGEVTWCRIHRLTGGDRETLFHFEQVGEVVAADDVASMIVAGTHQFWVLRWRDQQHQLLPERVRVLKRGNAAQTLSSCDKQGRPTKSLHVAPRLWMQGADRTRRRRDLILG